MQVDLSEQIIGWINTFKSYYNNLINFTWIIYEMVPWVEEGALY